MSLLSKHTPTPWFVARVEDRWGIFERSADEDTRLLIAWVEPSRLGFTSPRDAEDARLIVRAVNAHADLLAALEELLALVRGECPSVLSDDSGGNARVELSALAAIAKARGDK